MTIQTAHLCLRSPYEPLFSDRYLIWLAGTLAASGSRVVAHTAPLAPGPQEILLTNFSRAPQAAGGAVLQATSPTDRTMHLMRPIGKLWAASGLSGSQFSESAPVKALLGLLRKPFTAHSDLSRGRIEATEESAEIPAGRRLMFRVNVDWDSRGLDLLDRWCGRFGLRPTLAVAGSEIAGNEARVREVVARHGIEIAGHTWSHRVVLPALGTRRVREEITRNKAYLEDFFGNPVHGFAAPYMKYDRRTFECLAESGHRWFIRSWSVHPLPLPGFDLLDLGVSCYFPLGWENALAGRLALSDLVLQLHLPDLVRLEAGLESVLADLSARGVRFASCGEYYDEVKAGGRV
ncbi:polysaccharide deacetylase family protein [bacterium]|nr:polysaccharide deacetylase family protein [bacterium]